MDREKPQRKNNNLKELWRKFRNNKKNSGPCPVLSLSCIFDYFLNFASPYSSIKPYENRGVASSSSFSLPWNCKKSLNYHKTQLVIIYACAIFVVKNARNFRFPCFIVIWKPFCFSYLIESPLKMMKNAFYFILKTLFVLFIF